MNSTKEKIYNQHAENMVWTNTINFYKDDLKVLSKRLEELVSKNNQSDFLKSAEHFQNQFIIQKNNMDEILHEVKINEDKLQKEIIPLLVIN